MVNVSHALNHSATAGVKRCRGRQRNKWAEDIEEWSPKPFSKIPELGHDRERWRGLTEDRSSQRRPHDFTRDQGKAIHFVSDEGEHMKKKTHLWL